MIRQKKFTVDVKVGATEYRYRFLLIQTDATAVTIMEARAKNTETWRDDRWSDSEEEIIVGLLSDPGEVFRNAMLKMLDVIPDLLGEAHPLCDDGAQTPVRNMVRNMRLAPAEWKAGL